MNYTPNSQWWEKGNIVLHDADEKSPQMLMKVIGRTRDGLIKTQYIDKRRKRTIWKNDVKYLHDPRKFEIRAADYAQEYLESSQRDWELVRWWNAKGKSQIVITTSADGDGKPDKTGRAEFRGTCGFIWLERQGWWSVTHVQLIKENQS